MAGMSADWIKVTSSERWAARDQAASLHAASQPAVPPPAITTRCTEFTMTTGLFDP
jgi:hypothetical protein